MESSRKERKSVSLCCFNKRNSSANLSFHAISTETNVQETNNGVISSNSDTNQRKPAGWKAMPYILGNETFEKLGSIGLTANLTVYLVKEYHMDQVRIALMLTILAAVGNFLTTIGAFISDAYAGKFLTIAVASFANLLGMVIMTLTAMVPNLRPPPCTEEQRMHRQCVKETKFQLAVFLLSQVWMAIGAAGIRPCSLPFGVDQFDSTSDEGRRGIPRFFNWYYTSSTTIMLVVSTLVVFIQERSWVWGFAIPTICMFIGIVLFFLGTKIYVYIKPEGSLFSNIAQVFVAAYKKRHLKLPIIDGEVAEVLYNPPLMESTVFKVPYTKQFSCLNKAAIAVDNDLKPNGSLANPWRLCSIQQVEQVKYLIRIIPIWATSVIGLLASFHQAQFMVQQALQMDRHLGPKFEIPAVSVGILKFFTVATCLPLYDCILVPLVEKFTGTEGGFTVLQRIGIGNFFGILAMFVSGIVEKKRRDSAILHVGLYGIAPMSVMWLAPQLMLMGLYEVFGLIGMIEFYNRQFPEHMRSIGNSLGFLTGSVATYIGALLITIVQRSTTKHGQHSWLNDNANAARLDYYFYLIAGMGLLNFIIFLFCAQRYRYKPGGTVVPEPHPDTEPSSVRYNATETEPQT